MENMRVQKRLSRGQTFDTSQMSSKASLGCLSEIICPFELACETGFIFPLFGPGF